MSDEENDLFSGSVTSQPQMVNVQTSGPMYMVERSSAPQVIGILVIIYGVLLLLASLFGLVDGFRQSLLTASVIGQILTCLLYTSPSPRDRQKSRMPSSA